MPSPPNNLAVLIDAENAQAAIARGLFEEIARIGIASVRRIYGDFSGCRLKAWEGMIKEHSIQAFQIYPHCSKGNSSDFALVIDAMDLLHGRQVQGFCIVSSDSDFTRLASRIRESGAPVYGFGERKTPKPFVNACHRFIYTESLRPLSSNAPELDAGKGGGATGGKAPTVPPMPLPPVPPLKPKLPIKQLVAAVDRSADSTGWAHLSDVGNMLGSMISNFNTRSFGFSNLTALMSAVGGMQVERRPQGKGHGVFVRKTSRTAD